MLTGSERQGPGEGPGQTQEVRPWLRAACLVQRQRVFESQGWSDGAHPGQSLGHPQWPSLQGPGHHTSSSNVAIPGGMRAGWSRKNSYLEPATASDGANEVQCRTHMRTCCLGSGQPRRQPVSAEPGMKSSQFPLCKLDIITGLLGGWRRQLIYFQDLEGSGASVRTVELFAVLFV